MVSQYQSILPFVGDYSSLCLREFLRSNLSTCNRCLILGCGPLPITTIIFSALRQSVIAGILPPTAQLPGDAAPRYATTLDTEFLASILEQLSPPPLLPHWCTSVDKEPRAIESARSVIKRLKLEDSTDLVVEDALQIDTYDQYDLIHVAAMVSQKTAVLRRIAEQVRSGSQIIVRFPAENTLQSLLYETMSADDIHDLSTIANLTITDSFQPLPGMEIVTGFLVFQKV